MLLLEISQLLLAGARLGAQIDFTPTSDYQPDVGPDADLDELRLRLAELFGGVDTYSFVFDPYDPEQVESQLSDDLTQVAADLENGLRHFASATPPRRCGGGSSPTSRPGATSAGRCSTPCSRSWPTTGSTWSTPASSTGSRPPTRCSRAPRTPAPDRHFRAIALL